MAHSAATSFGPVLFVGLSGAALITHTTPEVDLQNPADVMDVPALATPAPPVETVASTAPPGTVSRHLDAMWVTELPERDATDITEARAPQVETEPTPRRQLTAGTSPAAQSTPTAVRPAERPAVTEDTTLGLSVPERLPGLAALRGTQVNSTPPPRPDGPDAQGPKISRPKPQTPVEVPDGTAADLLRPFLPALPRDLTADRTPDGLPQLRWRWLDGDRVHVRAAPGLAEEVITQFDTGTRVLALDVGEGWTRINLPLEGAPVTGWIANRYLSETPPE